VRDSTGIWGAEKRALEASGDLDKDGGGAGGVDGVRLGGLGERLSMHITGRPGDARALFGQCSSVRLLANRSLME
jgi:hypothetical protein